MAFFQTPPTLENQFTDDVVLREYLARVLSPDVLRAIEPELLALGGLAAGELFELSAHNPQDEPRLVSWSAWGKRSDRIELSRLWQRAQPIAAQFGVVAAAYDKKFGAAARIHQMSLVHLFNPSSGVYTCPLAMTDGAAATLKRAGNQTLIDRAVPRLTSREPAYAWTSGQWMTERTGGSDVAISETIAKPNDDGTFGLYGTKWFTSATTSQMALTLARPEGNPPGGSGLALFYLEVRDEAGNMNGISINRLKDKLGTRHVPTAELTLDGTRAIPVIGHRDGIKNITPMLAITRTWNAVCAASFMRRITTLARSYAKQRVAFGATLDKKPLHVDTLAWMEAESMGAFFLTFRAVELLGKEEAGVASEAETQLLRLLTPIAKLTTGKQGVAVVSEGLEAFGGAGYVEDTGLPVMLRDAQVMPIWEGTTNVLSLDLLRALSRVGSLSPIMAEIYRCTEHAPPSCKEAAEAARSATTHAERWLASAMAEGIESVEAGARRMALTLGRALEVALLVEHAAWEAKHDKPLRAAAAARRLVASGVDLVLDSLAREDAALLA